MLSLRSFILFQVIQIQGVPKWLVDNVSTYKELESQASTSKWQVEKWNSFLILHSNNKHRLLDVHEKNYPISCYCTRTAKINFYGYKVNGVAKFSDTMQLEGSIFCFRKIYLFFTMHLMDFEIKHFLWPVVIKQVLLKLIHNQLSIYSFCKFLFLSI